MHEQPNDRNCNNPAIGGNHDGPVIIYMSKVDDATSADGSGSWFKVAEYGYDTGAGLWGTDYLNENCGRFPFTVPSSLPDGDYLIRAEVIALHVASSPGGAQFYMSCYVSDPNQPRFSLSNCFHSKSPSLAAPARCPAARASPACTLPPTLASCTTFTRVMTLATLSLVLLLPSRSIDGYECDSLWHLGETRVYRYLWALRSILFNMYIHFEYISMRFMKLSLVCIVRFSFQSALPQSTHKLVIPWEKINYIR
jgi:hypothetical protein